MYTLKIGEVNLGKGEDGGVSEILEMITLLSTKDYDDLVEKADSIAGELGWEICDVGENLWWFSPPNNGKAKALWIEY